MATNNSVNVGLSGSTGTGNFVGDNTPTLITPVLGAATATSVNFGGSTLSNYVTNTSFTPVFTFQTPGNISVVYTSQIGTYVRIGSIVYYNFRIDCTPTFTTSSGNLVISGLPITINASINTQGTCVTGGAIAYGASYTAVALTPVANSTGMFVIAMGSSQAIKLLTTAAVTSTSAVNVYGTGFYYI